MDSEKTVADLDPATTCNAYICYSRKDARFAAALEEALQGYKPPADVAPGQYCIAVYRDEQDEVGAEYQQSLEERLKSAQKLIVVCSPNACKNDYVDLEIEQFCRLHGPENIIPVILAGTPNNEAQAGQEGQACFPPALMRTQEKPAAINYMGFHPGKDKIDEGPFSSSWNTLISKLYGVQPAHVEQDPAKIISSQRRVTAVVVAIILLIVAAALYVAFNHVANP